MWLFTPIGFFSIVQKPGDDDLTIRSRVAGDLEFLRERYLPSLSPIMTTLDGDYAFRATASHRDFAESLASMAASVDYDNFKDEVAKKQGGERAEAYSKVWGVMQRLQEEHLVTANATYDCHSHTTITNADLVNWKRYAKSLRVARMVFAAVAATNPCHCEKCSHCQELARLDWEIEKVCVHASSRLAWLDRRARAIIG